MTSIRIDDGLLADITYRLELRTPNRGAVESVAAVTSQHYDVDGGNAPYECIVDSATGVGKTYVMAGLIEYFAGLATPVRNFLLLAPGRTIRDKSIQNFTPGHRRSLTAAMRSRPHLVTADNFDSPATYAAMSNTSITKLFIFTVQSLTSSTGEGRATHEYQEGLGSSLYKWLSELNDLVILADEHHCYRGPAFSRTITALNPELVVGVTATPDKRDDSNVVYRYPLAQAIADRYVKTPVLVARRDDRHDDQTKLRDGVTLLRHKETLAHAYCAEHGLPPVNPVMLVIAQNIAQAEQFRDILDSESFDGGAWIGRTLLVHSNLSGDEKEAALADLDAVEDPQSQVRIIISVGMLKEGWDVKNVYVIASMRASVSEVLTEQTLGRGMRLPFGDYTNIEMLDTVEVLAHERYEELLRKREALNEKFVDHTIYVERRRTADGDLVARRREGLTEGDVITPPLPDIGDEVPMNGFGAGGAAVGGGHGVGTAAAPGSASGTGLRDLDNRLAEGARAAEQTQLPDRDHEPLPDRPGIVIPYLEPRTERVGVSLNQIHDLTPFASLGRALSSDVSTDLRRTKLEAGADGKIRGVDAEGTVQAAAFDTPLKTSRSMLVSRIMALPQVERRPAEVGKANEIVTEVITAMGDDAAANLSAFFDRCARRVEDVVSKSIKDVGTGSVTYHDVLKTVALDKTRTARSKQHQDGHADAFSRSVAYGGWKHNLYPYAWFDSTPEYKVAQAVDDAGSVTVWARLHRGDIPITWTVEGRQYNPDLVVVEGAGPDRVCWLVETKADKDVTSQDVLGKKRAAKTWASTVNNSEDVDGVWRYLLLREADVTDAGGSWQQMKEFGQ